MVGGPIVSSNGYIDLNRDAYAKNGLSWYSQSYPSWSEYMSPGAATSTGPHGDLTAPSGTFVTSWALRNYIENAAGYGWTFESAANTTTPAVKFEIRSSDGLFHSYGNGIVDGSIGIGTTAPSGKLDVSATTSDPMYLRSSSAESDIDFRNSGAGAWQVGTNNSGNGTSSNQFYIYDNNASAYYFTVQRGTGNVGIGLTTPTEKLEVSGAIKIQGASATDNNSPALTLVSDDDFLYDAEYINHYAMGFHQFNDGAGLGWNTYASGYYGIDLFTGGAQRFRINNNGTVKINNLGNGSTTRIVVADLNGNLSATTAIGSGIVTGSGTTDYLARWTSASTLGTGATRDNGTDVGIGMAPGTYKLSVSGNTYTSGKYFGHLNVDDTRGVNTAPTGYNNEVAFDFKQISVIGAPGSGTYGGLITMSPWGDNSGDASHQLHFNEGGIYWRQGQPDAATWDSWSQVLTTTPGGSGVANRVAYWNGANTLTSSGQFVYAGENLSVYDAETSVGEVRLGAAWGRPGVYSSSQLELFSGGSYITFGNANTEYMRLTAAGNLGIGSTAPNQKLDVVGAIRSTNYHYINHSSPSVVFQDTDERSGVIHVNSNLMYFLSGNGTNGTSWTQNGSYWPLYLNLNSDEAYFGGPAYFMEGSVGIGNNSPAYRLHVSGDIYANGGWLRVSGNQGLYFESHGTGIQSVEADGGQYGSVSTYGNEGGWDGYSIGGRYVWMAQDGGQQCGLYNDVDNYWYLLINRLATDNGYQFMNSYTGALNMRIQHTNGSRYASYDGDSNWDFYSDRRLKEHIENEENILDRLLKLDVVNYHFIDECKEEKEIGFIAQDVEQYFPSLVSEATDARYDFKVKTLGYSSFGVLAVGAIKELKIEKDEEVAGLNKKVTELLKEIESLKTENERIKAHFNTEIEIIKAALNSNNILIQSASTK